MNTDNLNTEIYCAREALLTSMRSLAKTLERKATKLEEQPNERYVVNGLGEVQGSGSQIDVLCARYAMLLMFRDEFRN